MGSIAPVLTGVRHLGLLSGERATPSSSSSTAQVAAVIVDPTALNKATAALEALNFTLVSMNSVAKDSVRTNAGLAEEMDRIREELRIHREISRR
ncbi:hypothetical protein G8E10_17800 [Rhizobiaceae bacterium CRRU44]|uniref:Uncharacterized protein n=1 Tax=Ferranicluibacter rubi TaxID=2715133 RepID=A0AA44CDK6_9HYPH|nr:hypothetical protein [Ferranicluibacter rubi]NHT77571.1 hypothetical protein [Ferranicluibacter rubi]